MIALIVTVVVLLILAGISIATLTGNNGIIEEAGNAKNATEQKQAEEEIETAILQAEQEHRNTTIDDVINKLIDKDIIDSSSQVNKGTGAITTNKGFVVEGMLGNYLEIIEMVQVGETAKKTQKDNYNDKTTTSQTNTATIPKDFTVSNKDGETIIDSGLVVIAPDGSEFVWVPVPRVIANSEANAVDEMAVNLGTDAVPKYRGLLYSFSGTTSTVRSGCTEETTSSFREPAYLTNLEYGDASTYNDIGITQDSLQKEYNAMIESVKIYGGFYVGRYESSLNDINEIQSKEEIPTSAGNSNTYRWYGLYTKQKEYTTSSVQGSMIWGSQYDAMLNWVLNGTDKSKVTAKTNGNHSGKVVNTGTTTTDKINNIYDLEGNLSEWTLEAYYTSSRVSRGCVYINAYSPSHRSGFYPNSPYTSYGSRLTLYIK